MDFTLELGRKMSDRLTEFWITSSTKWMDEVHRLQSLRTVHTYGGNSRCSRRLLAMASPLNLLSTRPPPLFGICTNPSSKKYKFGAQISSLTVRSASNSQKSSHVRRLALTLLLMSVCVSVLDDSGEL